MMRDRLKKLRDRVQQSFADSMFRVYHRFTIERSLLWIYVDAMKLAWDYAQLVDQLRYDNSVMLKELDRIKGHDIIPGIVPDWTGSKGGGLPS